MHFGKLPTVMGILNVTPDSFSDGGLYLKPEEAITRAVTLIKEGADIIDVGGESSRPGSDPVTEDEELTRVIPVIGELRRLSKIPISIDTTKAKVASEAIKAGANFINDISAGLVDSSILKIAAKAGVPICLMHMKGTPKNMQENPVYDDLMSEIGEFLSEAISRAEKAGVSSDMIIIDPGIGFGKTVKDNFNILNNLTDLKRFNKPILVGTSKKSFIGKSLNLNVEQRLEPTLATISQAYRNGATIFRVHDVGPTKRYLAMVQLLNE